MWWTSDVAQYGQTIYCNLPTFTGAGGTVSQVMAELVANPTSRPVITEIGMMVTNATGSASQFIRLGVPSSNGQGGQFSPWGGAALDPNSASQGLVIYNSWVVLPGAPSKYLRRVSTGSGASSPGQALVLRFPRGLIMTPGQHLVLYFASFNTNRYLVGDMWVEWDE